MLAAASLLGERSARAEGGERPLAEAIVVDGKCLDAVDLSTRIGRHLGRTTLDPRVRIVVFVDNAEESRVTVSVLREGEVVGVRRFGPLRETCSRLGAVVAVTIAVAIDQLVFGSDAPRSEEPEPAPPTASPAVPEPAPAPPTRPTALARVDAPSADLPVTAPRDRPWRLGGEGIVSFGILPAPGVGLAIFGSRALAKGIRLRGGGNVAWAGSVDFAGGEVTSWLAAGRIDGCYEVGSVPVWTRLSAAGCMGFAAGSLTAAGDGFARPATAAFFWPAVMLRMETRAGLGAGHAIAFAVDVAIPIRRPVIEAMPNSAARRELESPAAGLVVGLGWSWGG